MMRRSLGIVYALALLLSPCAARCQGAELAFKFPFAVIRDGVLYTQSAPGTYLAVDLDSHSILWRYSDTALGEFTKPVFQADDVVVAATRGENSEVLSLKRGRLQWRTPFVNLAGSASPVLCGSSVLLGDFWNRAAVALSLSTGKTEWADNKDALLHPPAVDDQEAIYAVGDREKGVVTGVLSISCRDGGARRRIPVPAMGTSRNPVMLYKDTIILTEYDRKHGTNIVAFERATMKKRWQRRFPGEVARYSPATEDGQLILSGDKVWGIRVSDGSISCYGKAFPPGIPPAVAPGRIVFQTGTRQITATSLQTHKRLWSVSVVSPPVSNPVYYRGDIFFQSLSNELVALSVANGKLSWSIPLQ